MEYHEFNKKKPGPTCYVTKDGKVSSCMAWYVPKMLGRGWTVCPKPVEVSQEKKDEPAKEAPKAESVKEIVESEVLESDKITIKEAAELSGKTQPAIRSLMTNEKIENVGEPGAPKVLKSEIEALE